MNFALLNHVLTVRAACAQTWTELLQGYRLAPVQFLDICGK